VIADVEQYIDCLLEFTALDEQPGMVAPQSLKLATSTSSSRESR